MRFLFLSIISRIGNSEDVTLSLVKCTSLFITASLCDLKMKRYWFLFFGTRMSPSEFKTSIILQMYILSSIISQEAPLIPYIHDICAITRKTSIWESNSLDLICGKHEAETDVLWQC